MSFGNGGGLSWGSLDDEFSDIFTDDVPAASPVSEPVPEPSPQQPGKKKIKRVSGAKRKTIIWRNTILATLVALIAFGIYGIVKPEQQLTETEIARAAAKQLKIGTFPADHAQPYVIAYMTDYLTDTKDRGKIIGQYGTKSIAYRPADGAQIIAGPFIGDIVYLSDKSANITVTANVTGAGWLSFSVPVIYLPEVGGFTIPSEPSLVPQPATLAQQPALKQDYLGNKQPDELAEQVEPVLKTFFSAYATSNIDSIKTTTIDGKSEPSAYNGLGGRADFVGISDISVWKKASMPEENWWVTLKVKWDIPFTISSTDKDGKPSTEVKKSTTVSEYQMKMTSRNGKFYVVSVEPRAFIVDPKTKVEASAEAGKAAVTGSTADIPSSQG